MSNANDPRRSPPILIRRQVHPAPQPVAAKPEPKPQPKPEPPPPPPARPSLPWFGAALPIEPLMETDVPAGTSVRLGTLARTMNQRTGRPLISLCVPCHCRQHQHFYPWRGDWPVDASVRSHQETRCRNHKSPDGVWLGLDPDRLEISQQASQEGLQDFLQWKAWWDALQPSERKAIAKGKRTAEPPDAVQGQRR